jgi:hypothetical protein
MRIQPQPTHIQSRQLRPQYFESPQAQRFERYNPDDPRHLAAMALFAVWSAESGTMLPLTEARMAKFSLSILGFGLENDLPLTYVALEVDEADENNDATVAKRVANIVGYLTNPDERRKGYGPAALGTIVALTPKYLKDVQVYRANVNATGLPHFLALGGVVVATREPFPATGCDQIVEIRFHDLQRPELPIAGLQS